MRHRSFVVLAVALVLCVTVGAEVTAAQPPGQPTPSLLGPSLPAAQAEFRARKSARKQAPIRATTASGATLLVATAAAPTADIEVTYNGFSSAAQAAFEAAISVWESRIVSSQVIQVHADWIDLGQGGVLGSAGPSNLYLMADNRWYSTALAESLCSCESPDAYEIYASFNSTFTDWYLGTDGNAPSDKYDFMTVVLHEIGHGLGFISTFRAATANRAQWGYSYAGTVYPTRYDLNEWTAATGGNLLTNTSLYANPSTALKTQLTDTTVYFGGSNVVATLGSRAKLYAPTTWSSGSSNSHFDEAAFPTGTQNALMTPFLADGEVIHDPGPATLALFRDIGWQTGAAPPVEPIVTLNLPTNTNTTHVPVTMTESDPAGTGIAGWFLSTSSTDPAASDPGWLGVEPTTFAIPAGDGIKTVHAWVKNNAGTVSQGSSDTTRLDTTVPTVSISAPSTTMSQIVAITLGGGDGGGSGINGWFVSESPTNPALNDPGWKSVKPSSFTLSGGLGAKTIYAWTRDAASNRSTAASANVELLEPLDVDPPTVYQPRADFVSPQTIGASVLVHVSWPPANDPSGISAYKVQFRRNSGAWTPASLPSPTQTSLDISLAPGNYYRFRVAATDTEGNTSTFATSPKRKLIRPQENATSIVYSGSWKRVSLAGASGGYVKRSLTAGNSATFTFTGNSVAFVTARGSNRGRAEVRLDGTLVATIDLYSPALKGRNVVWASTGLSATTHNVRIRVTGSKNPSSTGTRVDIDAFLAWL